MVMSRDGYRGSILMKAKLSSAVPTMVPDNEPKTTPNKRSVSSPDVLVT